jgi:hypothetical protein
MASSIMGAKAHGVQLFMLGFVYAQVEEKCCRLLLGNI